MTKNWINFRFLHICPVEKCEISPNLAKIHISPHLLCGKTEIPLHVEKFHVLKSEISPHGRFLLHLHVGDRGDKYQVWLYLHLFVVCPSRIVTSPLISLKSKNFKKQSAFIFEFWFRVVPHTQSTGHQAIQLVPKHSF